MTIARPWLPDEALNDGALDSAITASARDWLTRWFREVRHVSLRTTRISTSTKLATDAFKLANASNTVLFSVDKSWLTKLGASIVGVSGSRRFTSPLDQTFFERLGNDAARDLADAVTWLFETKMRNSTSPLSAGAGASQYALSLGAGSPVFNIYADNSAVVMARKRLLGPSPPPGANGVRAKAIERQSITLGARLGERRLPISEATCLAVGDVLVLDRPRQDDVAVTVNGASRTGALWRWREDQVRFELQKEGTPAQ